MKTNNIKMHLRLLKASLFLYVVLNLSDQLGNEEKGSRSGGLFVQANSAADYYGKLKNNFKDSVSHKLQNFNEFKERFHKSYNTPLEEALREKIYIGSQIKAGTSKLSYLAEKSSSFSSINQMSDWTSAEFESKLNRHDKTWHRTEDPESLDLEMNDPSNPILTNDDDDDEGRPVRVGEEAEQTIGQDLSIDQLQPSVVEMSKLSELANQLDHSESNPTDQVQHNNSIYHDHRKSGCISPVKNLGSCAGCFVFSTMALFEFIYCLNDPNKQALQFSEQYVIDCGRSVGIEGCSNGKEGFVADFVELYGLIPQSDYPFFGKVKKCPYKKKSEMVGQLEFNLPTLSAVYPKDFERLLVETPIIAAVYLSPNFRDYGGGVEDVDCEPAYGHGMLLVGDGTENGIDYWIYKNSWGDKWGENGYYRLAKRSNCTQIDNGLGYVAQAYLENKRDQVKFTKSTKYDAELIAKHVAKLGKSSNIFKRLLKCG